MKKNAKILDCTLRDGAYLLDKYFGDNTIKGVISGLVDAGLDYIEIGFLQDDGFGEGKTVFLDSRQAQKYIPEKKENSQFTVLADFSRYSIENLDPFTGKSFQAVRACFFKHERMKAIPFFKRIKELGYKLFIQPVDILGYSDLELIEFLDIVNKIEPYCFSVVDTFGSMYMEDLQRIFSLIHHNLSMDSRIGFHSHNNMQMSNALSQMFLSISSGKREVIVDTTLSGMGRGAGNTPTELIAEYMNRAFYCEYNLDCILDLIDTYMDNIKTKCSWGYSTPYFIAGCYSAHVNNIAYLTQKPTIKYKDIRFILNKIGQGERKRYNYELLENTYIEYLEAEVDDSLQIELLKKNLYKKNVLVLAPGKTIETEEEKIREYISHEKPVVITVNFTGSKFNTDYIFYGNIRRYSYWLNSKRKKNEKVIVTSNIAKNSEVRSEIVIISMKRLIKSGWEHMDNSVLMLLRLLDLLDINKAGLAGFDGYEFLSQQTRNYVSDEMETLNVNEQPYLLNKEIEEMARDFLNTKKSNLKLEFVTSSRFEKVLI